jgi:hypothetical protein
VEVGDVGDGVEKSAGAKDVGVFGEEGGTGEEERVAKARRKRRSGWRKRSQHSALKGEGEETGRTR